MKASPSLTVQSSFSLSMVSTWGKLTSDLTLGSQVSLFRASAESFRVGFCFTHRSAWTISSGYVEAMNICASSESGYRAIGATICSSSSGLKDNWAAPPAGLVVGTAAAAAAGAAAWTAGAVVGAAGGAALPYRLLSYGLVWP